MGKKTLLTLLIISISLLGSCNGAKDSADAENEFAPEPESLEIGFTYPPADTATNYSPSDMSSWETATWTLGANYTNGASTTSNYITFGVYAPNAAKVLLEIYSSATGSDARYDYWMAKGSDGIWRAKIYCTYNGRMYGFRAWGPTGPTARHGRAATAPRAS